MKSKFTALYAVLALIISLSFVSCKGDKDSSADDERVSIFSRPTVERVEGERKEWNDVDSFACYYGLLSGIAEEEPVMGGGQVTAAENLKKFDVAIIHSSSLEADSGAKELVSELQAAGTYVIAYISVGEDDSLHTADGLGENGFASYYIYENGMPKVNPNWGSYFVDAGNPVWQNIILNRAEHILSYGVDGLFLDTLDTVDVVYSTRGGMMDLVSKLDAAFPQAKLVANRGFTIFPYISQYLDGIMFESFSTTYNPDSGLFDDRSTDDLEYNYTIACNVINRARRYDYMPVFCLDYLRYSQYSARTKQIYNIAWQYDFIPYTTYSRALDVCPYSGIKPTSKRGELALSLLNESSGEVSANGDTSAANLAYAGNGLATVTADSVFPGYSGVKPLNDGFYATAENHNQLNWATENWASENNDNRDHWIQFAFSSPQDISSVIVYWAPDGNSPPTIYSPREAYVEAWIDGDWVRVAAFSWKNADGSYSVQQNKTEFRFGTVNTDKVRIVQPKGMGDGTTSRTDGYTTERTGIMWVSEVEIYK